MRRPLVLSITLVLLLSACSTSADLDDITIGKGENPTINVGSDFTADETTTRVVKEGEGDELAEGDTVNVNYVAVNGRTGKQFDSTFASGSTVPLTLGGQMLPGFIKGLTGQKIGSRVLVAVPAKDGFGQAVEQYDLKADDTMVFLFDLVSKQPLEAQGEAKDLPGSLPAITFDDNDHPNGFKPGDGVAANPSMSIDVAIQGQGAEIEKGQTLTVQYVGQVYPDGKVFDESWSKQPAQFPIGTGGLIKCWDEQLVGQKVGSRLVLVCPKDVAYGASPGHDLENDTLIFAIDVLAAS